MVEPASAATEGLDQCPDDLLRGRRPATTACGRTCAHPRLRRLRAAPYESSRPATCRSVVRDPASGQVDEGSAQICSSAPAKRQ
jgi:hypothetical protein